MSFYGIVLAFTILLCAVQLGAIYSEAGALNYLNLQYAGISHLLRIMSSRIQISVPFA
jgi:hypothetical protein